MGTPSVTDLALSVAVRPAAGLDLTSLLADTCSVLPGRLGVSAAVVLVLEPSVVVGSDAVAVLLGEAQKGAPIGPLSTAIRSGRPMLTPDLTRVGPPAMAAAASESGLTSSAAMALHVGGQVVGGLQVLGTRDRPVGEAHLLAVKPLVDVLAALLVDVRALHRPAGEPASAVTVSVERATGMLAERYGTDVDDAANLLATRARTAGRTLVEAATAIVTRADGPTPVPGARPRPTPVPRPRSGPEVDRAAVDRAAEDRAAEDRAPADPAGRHRRQA